MSKTTLAELTKAAKRVVSAAMLAVTGLIATGALSAGWSKWVAVGTTFLGALGIYVVPPAQTGTAGPPAGLWFHPSLRTRLHNLIFGKPKPAPLPIPPVEPSS